MQAIVMPDVGTEAIHSNKGGKGTKAKGSRQLKQGQGKGKGKGKATVVAEDFVEQGVTKANVMAFEVFELVASAAEIHTRMPGVSYVRVYKKEDEDRHVIYLYFTKLADVPNRKAVLTSGGINQFAFKLVNATYSPMTSGSTSMARQYAFCSFLSSYGETVDSAGVEPDNLLTAMNAAYTGQSWTGGNFSLTGPAPTPHSLYQTTTPTPHSLYPTRTVPVTMTRAGMVYAARSQSMFSVIKIGYTRQDEITAREKSLSNTSVSSEFDAVAHFRTTDCIEMERRIQLMLSKHRVNNKREFFDIDKGTAVRVLQVFYEQMLKGEIQGCSAVPDAPEPFWGADPDWVGKLEQEVDAHGQLKSDRDVKKYQARVKELEDTIAGLRAEGVSIEATEGVSSDPDTKVGQKRGRGVEECKMTELEKTRIAMETMMQTISAGMGGVERVREVEMKCNERVRELETAMHAKELKYIEMETKLKTMDSTLKALERDNEEKTTRFNTLKKSARTSAEKMAFATSLWIKFMEVAPDDMDEIAELQSRFRAMIESVQVNRYLELGQGEDVVAFTQSRLDA